MFNKESKFLFSKELQGRDLQSLQAAPVSPRSVLRAAFTPSALRERVGCLKPGDERNPGKGRRESPAGENGIIKANSKPNNYCNYMSNSVWGVMEPNAQM